MIESGSVALKLLTNLEHQLRGHSSVAIPKGHDVASLLLIWCRIAVIHKWVDKIRYFSTGELVLLSLILATITKILQRTQESSETSSFLHDYDLGKRLRLLNSLELFFVSIVVTKQVLDLWEDEVYELPFSRKHFNLMRQLLQQPESSRFKFFNRVRCSLHLYVVDIQHSLGTLTFTKIPLNSDAKIEQYLSCVLHHVFPSCQSENSDLCKQGRCQLVLNSYRPLPDLETFLLLSAR